VLNGAIRKIDSVQIGPRACEPLMIGTKSNANFQHPEPVRCRKIGKFQNVRFELVTRLGMLLVRGQVITAKVQLFTAGCVIPEVTNVIF